MYLDKRNMKRKNPSQVLTSQLAEQAIESCGEAIGLEAGETVLDYFSQHTNHPRPANTFNTESLNRDANADDTNEFAVALAYKMAELVIENDPGARIRKCKAA